MGMKFMPDLQFCKELPEIKPGKYRLKYDLTLRASPGLGTALCRGNYHWESCLKAESKVYICKIRYLSRSEWGLIENTGWICLYMNHKWLITTIA